MCLKRTPTGAPSRCVTGYSEAARPWQQCLGDILSGRYRTANSLKGGRGERIEFGAPPLFPRLKTIISNRSDQRMPVEPTAWVQKHGNLRGAEYYAQQGGVAC